MAPGLWISWWERWRKFSHLAPLSDPAASTNFLREACSRSASSRSGLQFITTRADSCMVTRGPCFSKSLPGQTIWRPPAGSGVSGATPYSTTLQAWAGPRAAPRGGLRGNEVRINLPLRSALALRFKPLGTPRLMPPDIPCFPSATPSFALALGHPSARKRLFQPQNCRVSSPAVPAVLPQDRWAWG